jgi:hypothetical protein
LEFVESFAEVVLVCPDTVDVDPPALVTSPPLQRPQLR